MRDILSQRLVACQWYDTIKGNLLEVWTDLLGDFEILGFMAFKL